MLPKDLGNNVRSTIFHPMLIPKYMPTWMDADIPVALGGGTVRTPFTVCCLPGVN